jgi:RNA polymerase sigma-70 factor (ECF subfamily)
MQLLALLRSVNADQIAPSARRETPLRAPFADRRPNADADPSVSMGQTPPDRGAEMLAQLRELPLDQREVLVLVAVERMSYTEIAAFLHMPVATVISRLSQAREALRSSPSKLMPAPKNAN